MGGLGEPPPTRGHFIVHPERRRVGRPACSAKSTDATALGQTSPALYRLASNYAQSHPTLAVGGEFPALPHRRPNELALPVIRPGPKSVLRFPRWFTQGRRKRRLSIRRHFAHLGVVRQAASRTHLTPPSVSDRARDSAAASDTHRRSPVRRPRPVPACVPSAPHGRDDRYSNAGTRGA
jgi:hypothetical protein